MQLRRLRHIRHDATSRVDWSGCLLLLLFGGLCAVFMGRAKPVSEGFWEEREESAKALPTLAQKAWRCNGAKMHAKPYLAVAGCARSVAAGYIIWIDSI